MAANSDSESTMDRRGILRRIGALGIAGAVGYEGFQYFGTQPAFALERETFTAADVDIASADGSINDVWFNPEPTYSWSGLDTAPDHVKFTLFVNGPDGSGGSGDYFETVGSETQYGLSKDTGTSGEGSYTFQNKLSMIDNSSWYKSAFENAKDGGTKTVGPIGVKIEAQLTTTDSSTYTATNTAQFSVDVTNQQVEFGGGNSGTTGSSGGVGGVAGTGGN